MLDLDSRRIPQEHDAGTYKQHIRTLLGLFITNVYFFKHHFLLNFSVNDCYIIVLISCKSENCTCG